MGLQLFRKATYSLLPGLFLLLGSSGCMATRGWVQKQLEPVKGHVAEVETRLDQTAAKTDQVTGRVSEVENNLGQTRDKADLALRNLENLQLEKRFVLSIKEGTNFAFDSANLTSTAQHAIDGFLGGLPEPKDAIFLVTGHTDNTGSENYNYELAQRRASSVARYLISRKGIDPLRVTTVSYGENAPMVDNTTLDGRHKNRRVEILVYKEAITPNPASRSLELERQSRNEAENLQ